MPIIDHHDLDELKNRNEEMVWKAIERYVNLHPEICRCRDCILDAAALSLNNLPPRYQVYTFHSNAPDEKEPGPDVLAAVDEAFKQVTKRPHH